MLNNSYESTALHKQPISILSNLEVKHLKLLGAKKWKGVGVNNSHKNSAYFNEPPTCNKYHAYIVKASQNALPILEWVETANCHYCGKLGHMKPMCLQYLAELKASKIIPTPFQHCNHSFLHPGKHNHAAN